MTRASRPCPQPQCYHLQPCAEHQRKPFAGKAKRPGGRPWQRTRERIFRRDGYVCHLGIEGCIGDAEVVDHILNLAAGGTSEDSNLQAACKPCNEQKRRVEALRGRGIKFSKGFEVETAAVPTFSCVRVFPDRIHECE